MITSIEDYANLNTEIVVLRFGFFYIFFFKITVKYGIMTDILIVFALLCLTFLAYRYYAYHNYYVGHSTYEYEILFISSPVFSSEKRLFTACFPIFRRCFIISRDIRSAFFHPRIPPKKKRRKKSVAISYRYIRSHFCVLSACFGYFLEYPS